MESPPLRARIGRARNVCGASFAARDPRRARDCASDEADSRTGAGRASRKERRKPRHPPMHNGPSQHPPRRPKIDRPSQALHLSTTLPRPPARRTPTGEASTDARGCPPDVAGRNPRRSRFLRSPTLHPTCSLNREPKALNHAVIFDESAAVNAHRFAKMRRQEGSAAIGKGMESGGSWRGVLWGHLLALGLAGCTLDGSFGDAADADHVKHAPDTAQARSE